MQNKNVVIVFFTLVILFLSYSCYLYFNLPLKNNYVSKSAQKGKDLWQQHNCNSCHQIYGLGGFLGPDLTNVYSNKSEGYINAFIKNGTSIMPRFNLSETDINCIIQYLKTVTETGSSDPRKFIINNDGTITSK